MDSQVSGTFLVLRLCAQTFLLLPRPQWWHQELQSPENLVFRPAPCCHHHIQPLADSQPPPAQILQLWAVLDVSPRRRSHGWIVQGAWQKDVGSEVAVSHGE